MPVYAYQKPVNRLYSYNRGYMNNYYKPLTNYIENKEVVERGKRAPSEQPGHQSLAERLKTFPMDGTVYRHRASSAPPVRRVRFDDDDDLVPKAPRASTARRLVHLSSTTPPADRSARAMSTYEPYGRCEIGDEESRHVPLWMKHPYRLPIEDIVVPPHESSVWPESVPHFNLVSSYDTMIGYLGLKQPKIYR